MASSLAYFSLAYNLDIPPWKQLAPTSRDLRVFGRFIDAIVGGDVAIRNTVCSRMTIGHATVEIT
jgi:hypothetical protein